jgi:hypothetical protein
MLGQLCMSVNDAIKCYSGLSKAVFSKPNWIGSQEKFKSSKLEQIMKDIVKRYTGREDEPMMATQLGSPESKICKMYVSILLTEALARILRNVSFVCAMSALNMDAGIPHLFRSYRAPTHTTFNCTIWEAARATTATPTLFKQITIGAPGSVQSYINGLGCNNPIRQLIQEAHLVFPNRHVACVLSLGTGKRHPIRIAIPSMLQQLLSLYVVDTLKRIATDCEKSAQEVAQRFMRKPDIYFRFNVEQGMQGVELSQWEKTEEVTASTCQYVLMAEVNERLNSAMDALMNRPKALSTIDLSDNNCFSVFICHSCFPFI